MKLWAIEGNTFGLDGGSMFGNAPKTVWSKWTSADASNRIALASRCLLVETPDGSHILFETGIGTFFEPMLKERFGITQNEHALLHNLTALGFNEQDIDAVVLSHLHFDHAGGLLSPYDSGPMRLLFPNARIYVGKEHWERAQQPHRREQASFIPQLHQLLATSDRFELIDTARKNICGLDIAFHYSHGHTIGLMLSEITLSSGPLVFVSDLAPGQPWMHLPIAMGFDRFPEQTINEKEKLFNSLLERNGKLFFTHDPNVPCVSVKKDGKGKFFGEPHPL